MISNNIKAQSETPKAFVTDVNNDGVTNIEDVKALIDVILKKGAKVTVNATEHCSVYLQNMSNQIKDADTIMLYSGGNPIVLSASAFTSYILQKPTVSINNNGVTTTIDSNEGIWSFDGMYITLYHTLTNYGTDITVTINAIKDPDYVISKPTQNASFPGGDYALSSFINQNMKYPKDAYDQGVQGSIYVQVTIEEDGTVTNPIIVRNVDPSLDAEAIRIVKLMPKWNPALFHNSETGKMEPIRSKMTIPIIFRI